MVSALPQKVASSPMLLSTFWAVARIPCGVVVVVGGRVVVVVVVSTTAAVVVVAPAGSLTSVVDVSQAAVVASSRTAVAATNKDLRMISASSPSLPPSGIHPKARFGYCRGLTLV
jgi:hypothetical protein